MRKLVIEGLITAQTPIAHMGVSNDNRGKKGENPVFKARVFGNISEENNSPICTVPTVSPNHFRGAIRDACADVVWEKLPESARDLYTHRMLYCGGFQEEKKVKGSNGNNKNNGEEKKATRPNPCPATVMDYLNRNLFVDIWGGHTQVDYVKLVPSKIKTFICPCWKGIEHVWKETARNFAEKLKLIPAAGDEYRNFIESLVNNPPRPTTDLLPISVYDAVSQRREMGLIEKYKKLYELSDEELANYPVIANLIKGKNYQTVEVIPAGASFICSLVLPLSGEEKIQQLEAGCVLAGLRRFAEEPFLGGRTAMGLGCMKGVFVASVKGEDGDMVLTFDGLAQQISSEKPEYIGQQEFLKTAIEVFDGADEKTACLFLDPATRPDALVESLKALGF